MSCDGHMAHTFEQDDPECTHCGHPRSEHVDDFWPEDRGHHVAASEEPSFQVDPWADLETERNR